MTDLDLTSQYHNARKAFKTMMLRSDIINGPLSPIVTLHVVLVIVVTMGTHITSQFKSLTISDMHADVTL